MLDSSSFWVAKPPEISARPYFSTSSTGGWAEASAEDSASLACLALYRRTYTTEKIMAAKGTTIWDRTNQTLSIRSIVGLTARPTRFLIGCILHCWGTEAVAARATGSG